MERQELRRIRRLFLSAFPAEERPPFFLLKRKARRNVDWWSIDSDGVWAGFFYVIREAGLAYVFFFAIDPPMRGKGCGTEAMRLLLSRYEGMRVFLAIEPVDQSAENYQERVNRKNFYERCGLSPLGRSLRECRVTYELLGVGGDVRAEDYRLLIDRWLGWPMRHLVFMRILP